MPVFRTSAIRLRVALRFIALSWWNSLYFMERVVGNLHVTEFKMKYMPNGKVPEKRLSLASVEASDLTNGDQKEHRRLASTDKHVSDADLQRLASGTIPEDGEAAMAGVSDHNTEEHFLPHILPGMRRQSISANDLRELEACRPSSSA